MGPFVIIGLFFAIGVLLFIGLYKHGKEHPEVGTVEIVEIDGRYAVRQYGYYAGYVDILPRLKSWDSGSCNGWATCPKGRCPYLT